MTLQMSLVSDDYVEALKRDHDKVARTATETFREAAQLVKQAARSSIAAGGFSGRWQNALRVNVYPQGGISGSPAIYLYHKISYAGQFEDPQPVHGRPLLWLPILANLPGGRRWSPALFTRTVGPLRAGRHGSRPILFGQVTIGRDNKVAKYPKGNRQVRSYNRNAKRAWLPVFIGVSSISDPKRFDIAGAVRSVGNQIAEIYSGKWEDD